VDFLTFIQTQKRILLDGAMGTQQNNRGLKPGGQNNLTNPEAVLEIHREYAQCGCHALITNTLTMNRIYIETHHVDVGVIEDGFIIETMFDLREALCALRACRDNFSLPLIVSMAFATEGKGGRTIMGNSAEECARRITDSGADVIGANCGDLDPFQMGVVVSLLQSSTSLPILAKPNAGKPKLADNVTVYEMDATSFAAGIGQCLRAGARLVGGCCGTSPEHIRAVASVFGQK